MNKRQNMEQIRRALQMFIASLDDDKALEVATVFPPWEVGKTYEAGERFTYGTNAVGDPQLYKVNDGEGHTSQADWVPGVETSLYTAIGLDDNGFAVWSQPTGAHDAYDKGDIVNYNGVLYESQFPGNTTVPGSDERYWKVYNA